MRSKAGEMTCRWSGLAEFKDSMTLVCCLALIGDRYPEFSLKKLLLGFELGVKFRVPDRV